LQSAEMKGFVARAAMYKMCGPIAILVTACGSRNSEVDYGSFVSGSAETKLPIYVLFGG